MTLGLRVCGLFVLFVLSAACPAWAHPLGNFTINHLSELDVRDGRINVRYILDIAEIPSFQIARGLSPDGRLSAQQVDEWAKTQAPVLASGLQLLAGGAPLRLRVTDAHARSRPGAGGLPTLYLTMDAAAALPSAAGTIEYRDNTYPGRIGWRDVIVRPEAEPTHELTAYPNAMLGSPRHVVGVELPAAATGTVAKIEGDAGDETATPGVPIAGRTNQLSDMLAHGTGDPIFVVLTLLVAIALGALHALEPGHGKTLLAITLVGARATVRQAGILAGALTFAHTAAVLALGLAINLFKGYLVPEAVYPWITLLSGAAIALIGARAVQRQVAARWNPIREQAFHVHPHVHEHAHPHHHPHDHAHPHDHDHAELDDLEHARLHAIPGTAPLKFRPAVWAAMSGGIAPCPAALVVLLAAIALNQVLYGVIVIVAFSLGLAMTLTGVGIGVVKGAHAIGKHPLFDRAVTWGPLASAGIMAAIGCVMLGRGFAEQGIGVSPLLVTLLAATAVAGYAFSHIGGHTHAETA